MDTPETRMHCLKMAMELGGKHEAVLSSAEHLLSFIVGPKTAVAVEVATREVNPIETPPVDAIASCGTALAMPDGGDLAKAVHVSEPVTADAEAHSAIVEALAEPDVTAPPTQEAALASTSVVDAVMETPETTVASGESSDANEVTVHVDEASHLSSDASSVEGLAIERAGHDAAVSPATHEASEPIATPVNATSEHSHDDHRIQVATKEEPAAVHH